MSKFYKTGSGKVVIGVGVVLIALLAYYAIATKGGTNVKSPATTVVTVVENDHMRGATTPKATVIEYGDFQCPACGAYEPIVEALLAKYPNDVRVVFRHFPLTSIHQNALLAATFSEAAAIQGKFWEMHDMMYANQKDWGETLTAQDVFVSYGKTLGLDTAKLISDAKSQAVSDKILAQYKEGVNLNINHTPTFYVNGTEVDGQKLATTVDGIVAVK